MKKRFIKLCAILFILIFGVTGCGQASQTKNGKNPSVIRIGYVPSAGILQVLPIVAKEKGWFDEEFKGSNTKIEFTEFKSGPVLMEAFASQNIDIGHIGDQPIFSSRANGVDVKAIALHSQGDKNYGLVVTEKSGIKKLEDLKGKKVAVTLGSIGQRIFNLYLEKYGLNQKDVEVVNVPPADIKNTLQTNNVDAAIIWQPWIGAIEKEKIGRQIADTKGLKLNVNITIATADFINKYPEDTKKLLKVYLKTEKWVNENKKEAAKIVAKVMKMDENIVFEAMQKEQYVVKISPQAIDSMEDTSKFLEKIGVIREPVPAKDCVELKFLKELGVQ